MNKKAGAPTKYRYIKYWSKSKNDWHVQAVSASAFEGFCKDLDAKSILHTEVTEEKYPHSMNY